MIRGVYLLKFGPVGERRGLPATFFPHPKRHVHFCTGRWRCC